MVAGGTRWCSTWAKRPPASPWACCSAARARPGSRSCASTSWTPRWRRRTCSAHHPPVGPGEPGARGARVQALAHRPCREVLVRRQHRRGDLAAQARRQLHGARRGPGRLCRGKPRPRQERVLLRRAHRGALRRGALQQAAAGSDGHLLPVAWFPARNQPAEDSSQPGLLHPRDAPPARPLSGARTSPSKVDKVGPLLPVTGRRRPVLVPQHPAPAAPPGRHPQTEPRRTPSPSGPRRWARLPCRPLRFVSSVYPLPASSDALSIGQRSA